MSLLGIDIGTTGCKVVAFQETGTVLAQETAEYPLAFPKSGWVELDASVVWEKLVRCIRSVAARTRRDPIKALSISSQGEAFLPVDASGNPLARSIVTFDNRAVRQVKWWKRQIGRSEMFRRTGMPLSAMGTLPKLHWLLQHMSSLRLQTRFFLCFHDFVVMKLGLPPVIDYSLAARTMMFDVNTLKWSSRILDKIEVKQDQLAEAVPSGSVVGQLSDRPAAFLGLPKGVVVVAGGHDQPCGAFGAGVIRTGEAAYAIGTVECITPVFERVRPTLSLLKNNLCFYPHVVPNRFVSLAFNFTGGSLLRWYRDTFGGEYQEVVRGSSSRPTSLLVLPHFTMTGTPSLDPHSKGVIVGLQLSTTKGQITRALLEGVTMEMRLNVELLSRGGISTRRFRAVGGGSKSPIWMQMKADILNRPIDVMKVTEASCLGAALLAGTALGIYRSHVEAVQVAVKKARTYEPHRPRSRYYTERFELYKQLYPTLSPILHAM